MNWTTLVRQFRLSRGLNQAELAELCGVGQPTVSRWECGKQIPDRRTRTRLRAVLHAQDSRSDDAIIRSVRFAHICSGLAIVDTQRVIETSVGSCYFHGISRADILNIPSSHWFKHILRTPETDWINIKALKNGDVLAINVTAECPIFSTAKEIPTVTTLTPLWFSDGTFILKGEQSALPFDEYRGQSVTAVTQDDVAYAL